MPNSSLHSPAVKDEVRKRLNRLTGQIAGIHRMVEEEEYCVDILQQIAAVRGALGKVASRLLEAHVNHCVYQAFTTGSERERLEKIDELVSVFEKSMRS
ncbi:MAG: metal-sensitive transcriptional regulator [Candidatus Latescibacteria bacterium]|nr:metal-sensitive transcriptional regulator [Candidatus Latescibacterota bacterium]